jgi:hypothetical protein
MSELSPKARAIVEAGRNPQVFTGVDRERIRRGVRLRMTALAAITTTAGTAAAMSPAAKLVLVTVAATLLGGGAVSFWALRERAAEPSAAARQSSAPNAPVSALPLPAAPAPATTATTVSGDPERSNGLRRASRRSTTDASKAVPPLDAELTVLKQAREDLRAGRSGSAYQRLSDYDRRYGDGPLAQERQALSAIALCQWRPGAEAQTRAADFLRDCPESPLANRVRAACKQTSPAAQ